MFYLYILHSATSDKFYVGYTENVDRRIIEHNNGERTTYTSKHRPWVLVAVFYCGEIEGEAIKLERFVKKQKSRKLIALMINGEALDGILAQLVRGSQVRD